MNHGVDYRRAAEAILNYDRLFDAIGGSHVKTMTCSEAFVEFLHLCANSLKA